MMSPTVIWIGKPTTNTFICGATRAISPSITFTKNSATATGAAIWNTMNSDCAKKRTTSPATSSGAPANGSGTSWNEPAIPAISAWCASAARYSSVASASWNSPITVTLCDVSGLMTFTTAKPIWMSMISPANWIPVNSKNATKPSTSPTNTCASTATVSIPSPPRGAIGGTVRTTTNASSSPRPNRTSRGICVWEKIGTRNSIADTRTSTSSIISNCPVDSPKRLKPCVTPRAASLDKGGDAREDSGREIRQQREHERAEQQDGQRDDDDLRDERERRLLDLRDGLEHRYDQPRYQAQQQRRRAHEQRDDDRLAAQRQRRRVRHR